MKFSKMANNRKKVIAKAQNKGFKINDALGAGTRFFTYLSRSTPEAFSIVSVSYRKRAPMVKITHKYRDGTTEVFEKVLVNKTAWAEIMAYLTAEPPSPRKKRKKNTDEGS